MVICRGEPLAGLMVMAALADFDESALLVAVTVALVCEVTFGAVYRPLASTEPTVADQVTAVLAVPVTVAVNCCFPCDNRLTLVGDRLT